jgi:chromosome segregation protein
MEKRTLEEGSLSDIEKNLSSDHHAYEAFKDTLTKAEVSRAELRRSLEHLRERAAEDFPDESREALDSSLGDEDRARPLEEVEQTLEAEEGKLRRLGAVNLIAIEEFKEVEERWTFLTAQRDDILKSVASLEETIRDLDATSSRRFQEAFEAVRGNFQRVFARLFEGGMGDLRLVPEDDYLNGGLEIIAQPPGKKLQSIELLSGGEKALSAIAFLFAAFEYKPSPFCILDEVDAALDDANIERFGKLLRDNAGQVQFICITHNKRTMAIADALYGITMEEPGISNVLSVRLDEAPSYAASAAP